MKRFFIIFTSIIFVNIVFVKFIYPQSSPKILSYNVEEYLKANYDNYYNKQADLLITDTNLFVNGSYAGLFSKYGKETDVNIISDGLSENSQNISFHKNNNLFHKSSLLWVIFKNKLKNALIKEDALNDSSSNKIMIDLIDYWAPLILIILSMLLIICIPLLLNKIIGFFMNFHRLFYSDRKLKKQKAA